MDKKIITISVLIAVLFVSTIGIAVYYTGIVNDKNTQITSMNTQIASLNTQITSLNSQINSLNSKITQLTNPNVVLSGSIQEYNASEITFTSTTSSIQTSTAVYNNQYSVSLLNGQSYSVTVTYLEYSDGLFGLGAGYTSTTNSYSIYIPSGVKTFTANF